MGVKTKQRVRPLDRTIGANIDEARKEAGVSQKALAELLDVSQAHISNLLAGKTTWAAAQVQAITAWLGVPDESIGEFFVSSNVRRLVRATIPTGPVAQVVRAEYSCDDARVIRLPRSEPLLVAA